MAYGLKATVEAEPDRTTLLERLSLAHARIEASFLEGGATLISVMEMVNGLIETLDRFTRTLDGETADATIDGLQRTISDLANLPQLAGARQASFDRIADLCTAAFGHVDEMRETFRYLKVFAATVKITAYDYAIYGGLEGHVELISPDTLREERQVEDESYYRVLVRTTNSSLTAGGNQLPIIPGMTASVEIRTGEKTVMDYVLKPVLKVREALRER